MNTNGKMKKEKFIELNQELDKIQEIQEIKMEIQSQNNNSTNEIFLYIFIPKSVEIEFILGYSLNSTIKMISIVLFILGIFDVLMTYLNNNFFGFLESYIYSVLYLVSGIYLFISILTLNYNDAIIGYKLFEFLFVFEFGIFILNILFISIGIIRPLGEGSAFLKKFCLYLGIGIFVEIIKLYLLWIIFSYSVHLKLNRVNIILQSK